MSTDLFLPPSIAQPRESDLLIRRRREVNSQFYSLACAGKCGRSVRVHPAVKLVVCASCTLAQVREKRRT